MAATLSRANNGAPEEKAEKSAVIGNISKSTWTKDGAASAGDAGVTSQFNAM